ncbi:CotD family spore coat protein [Tuberibacillus sp. Marseille-P3662]|uniref:CotD family spore coat protein n=1 Tax=Tuberibacillus sp. Marseille-P3662 TaxID=1965358 RepID=UPI0020CB19FF|nr:CotD family spore coat protein [Tuberibacillus sp. Marseille-P3662]
MNMGFHECHPMNCDCHMPVQEPVQHMPCPPQMMPAQFDPPQENVVYHPQDVIIPHVHPSHTTHVNQLNYKHMHYFPHTESMEETCTSEEYCCPGPFPHW